MNTFVINNVVMCPYKNYYWR